MKKYKIYGTKDRKPSEREIRNRRLAYEVAAEGIVLLENNGVLPLKPQKIALYGTGARMTAKGGMGSGDVHERYSVNIEQGLQNAGFEIVHPLCWIALMKNTKRIKRRGIKLSRKKSRATVPSAPCRCLMSFMKIQCRFRRLWRFIRRN